MIPRTSARPSQSPCSGLASSKSRTETPRLRNQPASGKGPSKAWSQSVRNVTGRCWSQRFGFSVGMRFLSIQFYELSAMKSLTVRAIGGMVWLLGILAVLTFPASWYDPVLAGMVVSGGVCRVSYCD